MFDILESTQKDDVVAVRISGELTKDDYERLTPLIEQKIQEHGNIKMFFEMEDVENVDYGAMWEELKFDARNSDKISKVAVVGDRSSESLLTRIKNNLTTAETKFFNREDRDAALKWI